MFGVNLVNMGSVISKLKLATDIAMRNRLVEFRAPLYGYSVGSTYYSTVGYM